MERRAKQQIAEGDAEDQGRHEAGDEEGVIPDRAPQRALQLGPEGQSDRAEDKADQHEHHRQIEAREGSGVEQRPSGKDRAAAKHEPDLIAFPHRTDGVHRDAPLAVGARDEGMEHGDAEIEAVHDRETGQQDAEQRPPDQAQGCIIEKHDVPLLSVRRREREPRVAGSVGVVSGPMRTYLTIRTRSMIARIE